VNGVELTGATPTLQRYLGAVDDLAERALVAGRVDAVTTAASELKARITALGAAGGRLDAVTWAARTAVAFDRILAVLGGEADPATLGCIAARPLAPAAPGPVPAAAVDPVQHALAV
jgi:hypothetical protein